MAHVRKDTRVAAKEWWAHLRPFHKRKVSKAERRAAKDEIEQEVLAEKEARGLGLHKDPKKMEWLKANKGETVVPRGIYCYGDDGNCPYWDKAEKKPKQVNGFCWLLGLGDWEEGGGELWDACKSCGVHDGLCPDGVLEVEDEEKGD